MRKKICFNSKSLHPDQNVTLVFRNDGRIWPSDGGLNINFRLFLFLADFSLKKRISYSKQRSTKTTATYLTFKCLKTCNAFALKFIACSTQPSVKQLLSSHAFIKHLSGWGPSKSRQPAGNSKTKNFICFYSLIPLCSKKNFLHWRSLPHCFKLS